MKDNKLISTHIIAAIKDYLIIMRVLYIFNQQCKNQTIV